MPGKDEIALGIPPIGYEATTVGVIICNWFWVASMGS